MDENTFQTIMDIIVGNILVPGLMIISGAILVIAKNFADRITKSVVEKNEKEAMKNQMEATQVMYGNIDSLVEAAVAQNMIHAEELKEASTDGKLTEEEIQDLQSTAKDIVYEMLPDCLVDGETGIMQQILGSIDLEVLMNSLIEKHVMKNRQQ